MTNQPIRVGILEIIYKLCRRADIQARFLYLKDLDALIRRIKALQVTVLGKRVEFA